ncbi:MAG: hypothetical protein JNK55_02090 [Rubrivivax sp.]|nr:hypothetical protein [Rubrivivax sp.]
MKLADGIRKHGFRKWYERELLQSHAHLLLCFLCVIGLFAAFEAAWRFEGGLDRLANLGAGLLCAATGLWALRRYLTLLNTAEAVANQAECPQCKAYGRLELLQSDATGEQVRVRCRGCGHGWRIGI